MRKELFLIFIFACPLFSWGQAFKYPELPDSIRNMEERIDYMTEHFWNEESIADTNNFQKPKLILDYLYLLKRTTVQKEQDYIDSFISIACKQKNTFGLILYWLDNILYESSSPYYDESLYLKLMFAVVTSEADSVMKLIPQQRIEMMSKNQIGKRATNFSFIEKTGRIGDLYSISSPLLLLVFNNPDCSLCHKTEGQLEKNKDIQALMDSGNLQVIAITPDANYGEWMEHNYPQNWIVGYDMEKIIYKQQLYDIQRLPCIYLLDKEKRVLLKEADYNRLCNYLSEEF